MKHRPRVVVLLGVSGSGKSLVGNELAKAIGGEFLDGDDFHPPANKAKMTSGQPLTDEDRWPWLRAIAQEMKQRLHADAPTVFACSGLKKKYRDILRVDPRAKLVLLDCDRVTLESRLSNRKGHFFPPNLLDSQLRSLEYPLPDEGVTVVDGRRPIQAIIETILDQTSGAD